MYLDNGTGEFSGLTGASINYTTKYLQFPTAFTVSKASPVWQKALGRYWFAGWGTLGDVPVSVPLTASVTVNYLYGNEATEVVEEHVADVLRIDLTPGVQESAIPGSVRFALDGKTIVDRNGALVTDFDPATGTGTTVGTFDYAPCKASLTAWLDGADNTPTLQSLRTTTGRDSTDNWIGRTPSSPVKPTTFTIRATRLDGTAVTATADGAGIITGDGIVGYIVYLAGIYNVAFGQMVTASGNEDKPWYDPLRVVGGQVWQPLPILIDTLRTDSISLYQTALRSDVTGIDRDRIPDDGRLPEKRIGDLIAVHHTTTITVVSPVAGATLDLERTGLDRVWVTDADGVNVPASKFVVTEQDRADGLLHWADPLSTAGYALPWTVHHRIWFVDQIDDMDNWGRIVLANKALDRTYPLGSYVSSLMFFSDMQASASVPFFQTTWDGVWQDTVRGTSPQAAYDYLNYPIAVTNKGATINAKIALVFQTTTTYKCLVLNGPVLGQNLSIHEDFAPNNPATDVPYFTIQGAAGDSGPWGSGWVPGNAMRFNLNSSAEPVVFLKTLMPSTPTGEADEFAFEFRGNIDRP